MLLTSAERPIEFSAAALLRGARVALESDLDAAKECLRLLEGMLPSASDIDFPLVEPAAPRHAGRGGLAPWQIRVVSAHIDHHLSMTIGIGDLAELVRLSRGHFCRAFKASMGETAHTYITRRRIAHAQMLMLTTNETLSAISSACGLSDQAHLTRLFRRFVSQTPLAWRRSNR